LNPDEIRAMILSLVHEQAKGPKAHEDAELEAERAEDEYEAKYDRAFLDADGNIEERKAQARLATRADHERAFVARAAHNRVKLKMKHLDSSIMAHQSVLKSVMAEGA